MQIVLLALVALAASSFVKVGTNAGSTDIQVNNIGSDDFNPKKISNWHYEVRAPLIAPKSGGSCPPNIYNANCVNNGGDKTWNVYFGGWDGVSSCHDSVSISVTLDGFKTFNAHYPMIATGSVIHVNNPSAQKVKPNEWLIVTTQLQTNNLNKPSISKSTNGVNWNPNQGGVPSANIQIRGYPGWAAADVNGGNVIFYDNSTYHLFFDDFKKEAQHSVFHATSKGDLTNFDFVGVSLASPMKVLTDLKFINGYYLMGLHFNGPEIYYSVSRDLNHEFPAPSVLFQHHDNSDRFIVSVGYVVDSSNRRLLGALYGAGAVSALDQNSIFGVWLQKKVLFFSSDNRTVWGIGDASRSLGPDDLRLNTNAPSLEGKFYLYDTDYVDANRRGTLLEISQTVRVTQGDIWEHKK